MEGKSKKPIQIVKFNIEQAAANWDVDRRTLSKRFKVHDIAPDTNGQFSVAQINAVVFGDIYQADLRKLTAEADILERRRGEMDRLLIPSTLVEKTWEFVLVTLRQIIVHNPKLTQEVKADILRELREIPIDDYYANAKNFDGAEAEEAAAPAGAASAAQRLAMG
jgi:hypothetical protein